MNALNTDRLYTVDEYLAMERASEERHMYLDGKIYALDGETEESAVAAPSSQPRYTVDEYLAMERASEERHVYLDGRIWAMAGESDPHGIISVNLVGLLHPQLKGSHCQARTKDTKVRSGPTPLAGQSSKGFFSYPDIFVLCGEPEYHDAFKDVVLNPRVIFEVLSPSTESFDRGGKFTNFQTWNPSLENYVLVSQEQAQVEMFTRQTDGTWSYQRVAGLDATLAIPSIGCTLHLADVYDRVCFPTDPITS